MIDKHYDTIIAVLAEKVQEQANKIGYLQWKCEDLQNKLVSVERENHEI